MSVKHIFFPAFSVQIELLIQLKSFCHCWGWILDQGLMGWTEHLSIQRLKALQSQLSLVTGFPLKTIILRLGLLIWNELACLKCTPAAQLLFWEIFWANPLVLKNDLSHKFLKQPNNQGFFLENDYCFPKYNSNLHSYCFLENVSAHIKQIAFRHIL